VLLLATAGFGTSALFSSVLHLGRTAFVAVWALVSVFVWALYTQRTRVRIRTQLGRRWLAGVLVGLAVGGILVLTVLRQPASDAPRGAALVAQGLWHGVVYGVADALMLSVLPVLILYAGRPLADLEAVQRLRWAGVALLGSAVVTAAYHAGFAEYRSASLMGPVVGNLFVTLGYLVSGNPLAPILAHVLMHLAALLNGAATAVQLPPHY
jgi:hypothetical protein